MNPEFDLKALNETINSINKGHKSLGPTFVYCPYDILHSVAAMDVTTAPNFWNESEEFCIEDIKKTIEELAEAPVPSFDLFKTTFGMIEKIENESIETLKIISEVIVALQNLINNASKLAEGKSVTYTCINGGARTLHPDQGLCDNCMFHRIGTYGAYKMFEEWEHFSGNDDYPVGGRWEYYNYNNSLYANPKRIDLAKHCLKYLRDYISKYSIMFYPKGDDYVS